MKPLARVWDQTLVHLCLDQCEWTKLVGLHRYSMGWDGWIKGASEREQLSENLASINLAWSVNRPQTIRVHMWTIVRIHCAEVLYSIIRGRNEVGRWWRNLLLWKTPIINIVDHFLEMLFHIILNIFTLHRVYNSSCVVVLSCMRWLPCSPAQVHACARERLPLPDRLRTKNRQREERKCLWAQS